MKDTIVGTLWLLAAGLVWFLLIASWLDLL